MLLGAIRLSKVGRTLRVFHRYCVMALYTVIHVSLVVRPSVRKNNKYKFDTHKSYSIDQLVFLSGKRPESPIKNEFDSFETDNSL